MKIQILINSFNPFTKSTVSPILVPNQQAMIRNCGDLIEREKIITIQESLQDPYAPILNRFLTNSRKEGKP
jgi:hypothetical protein